MKKPRITQGLLKEHFLYNEKTGVFTRKTRKNSHGSVDAYGYLILKIKKHQYKAHRMAWLYVYGSEPQGQIDHINRDRLDNRIINLRDVSPAVNARNIQRNPNPKTNSVGVRFDRTKGLKKNFAIRVLGRVYRFATLKEAIGARQRLIKNLEGYEHERDL